MIVHSNVVRTVPVEHIITFGQQLVSTAGKIHSIQSATTRTRVVETPNETCHSNTMAATTSTRPRLFKIRDSSGTRKLVRISKVLILVGANVTLLDTFPVLDHTNFVTKYSKVRMDGVVDGTNATFRALLDDLQLDKKSCGLCKCYFPSKSSRGFGWMLAPADSKNKTTPDIQVRMENGWQLAKQVEEEFHITNFLMEPPWLCSNCLVDHYNTNSSMGNYTLGLPYQAPDLIVQRVRSIPNRTRVVELRIRRDPWKEFVMPHVKRYNDVTTSSHNRKETAAFLVRFQQELSTSVKIVTKHPNLLFDYQFLFDNSTGEVYHIDFDRAYQMKDKSLHKVEKGIHNWKLREMTEKLTEFVEQQGLNRTMQPIGTDQDTANQTKSRISYL